MPEPQCPHGCGRPHHKLPAIGNRAVGLHDCPGTTPGDTSCSRHYCDNAAHNEGLCAKHHNILTRKRATEARRQTVDKLTRKGMATAGIAAQLGVTTRSVVCDRRAIRKAAADAIKANRRTA